MRYLRHPYDSTAQRRDDHGRLGRSIGYPFDYAQGKRLSLRLRSGQAAIGYVHRRDDHGRLRRSIGYRLSAIGYILLALAVLLPVAAAAQQGTTTVTVIVHDLADSPQAGLSVRLEDAAGQRHTLTTDARGAGEAHIEGPSVWIREVVAADGTALQMDSNTADGGLRLPLDVAPLLIGFVRDGALLFRVPAAMDNPAFPDGVAAALVTPGAAGATQPTGAAPLVVEGDAAPAADDGGLFWLIIGGIFLVGLALGLLVWARARAHTPAKGGRR